MNDFMTIARKFIRLPWEVHDGKYDFHDEPITQSLAHSVGAKDYFKVPPADNELLYVTRVMAVPIIIASGCSRCETLQERNRWKLLSDGERQFVLNELGLDAGKHRSVLYLGVDTVLTAKMASYMAAAFAYTTYVKPKVISTQTFADLLHDSFTDFTAMNDLNRAGLLIITDFGSGFAVGMDKVYASLGNFLREYASKNGVGVIMDYPADDIALALQGGRAVTRQQVGIMYSQAFKPELRMAPVLTGLNVYQFPIDMQGVARERRKTVVI
jgi:hypothetical protein